MAYLLFPEKRKMTPLTLEIAKIITALVTSSVVLSVLVYFMKRVFDEYDAFKREIKSELRDLREKSEDIKEKVLENSHISRQINEKTGLIEKVIKTEAEKSDMLQHKILSQVSKFESSLKENEKVSKKLVDAIKSIFIRTKENEAAIKTVKTVLDDNHMFIKTKKD